MGDHGPIVRRGGHCVVPQNAAKWRGEGALRYIRSMGSKPTKFAITALALTVALAVTSEPEALAESTVSSPTVPAQRDVQSARDQFASAKRDEDAGNWQAALEKLEKVGSFKMTPGVRFHIAFCNENSGRLSLAVDGYLAAMTQARAENDADGVFNASLDRLVQLRPKLFALEDAERRQKEGLERMAAGEPRSAINAFTQAYAIYPSPRILWNLSLAEAAAGEDAKVVRHLHILMAGKDPYLSEAKKAAVTERLQKAREKLGMISVAAPPGAHVFFDGQPFPEGYAPGESVEFEPGVRTVQMEAAGRKKELSVSVKRGEVTRVKF